MKLTTWNNETIHMILAQVIRGASKNLGHGPKPPPIFTPLIHLCEKRTTSLQGTKNLSLVPCREVPLSKYPDFSLQLRISTLHFLDSIQMLLAQLNIVSTQQDVSMSQVLDTRADSSPLQEEGPDGGTGDQDSRRRHSSNSNE